MAAEQIVDLSDPLADTTVFQRKLAPIVEGVADIAEKQGFNLPASVVVGSYASRRLNSHVVPIGAEDTEVMLAFSSHLYSASALFGLFFAEVLTNGSSLDLRSPSEEESQLLHKVVTYLIARPLRARHTRDGYRNAYRIEVDALQFPPIVPNTQSGPLGMLFTDAMLSFVVAHEIVHLSHSLNEVPSSRSCQEKLDEEIACDVYGSRFSWQLMHKSLERLEDKFRALAFCGGPLFLTCLSTFERAFHARALGPLPPPLSGLVNGSVVENSYGSHPSPAYRRETVRANLQHTAEAAGKQQATELSFAVDDWAWMLLEGYWVTNETIHLAEFYDRDQW